MKILLVDDQEKFTEILECLIKDMLGSDVSVLVASGGHAAIEILKKNKIDLCICDHNMPNGMGNIVLKYIIDENKKTNFVLCSTVLPNEFPDLYPPHKVFFNIQKPDIYQGIELLCSLITDDSDANNKNNFIPLTPHFLLLLGITPADIYIKISNDKFIKCLNKNTPFDSSDFDKYQRKSLTKLFILRDENQKSIDQIISSAISKLMADAELPVDARMSISHAQLSEMIKAHGMTPKIAKITKENIKQSVSTIQKTNLLDTFWKDISPMGEYPSDLYALHSMLASAVAKKLIWNTEASMFKLIMAAFLQDASLNSSSLIKVYNYRHFQELEKSLERKEIKSFMNHPKAAKKMLSAFKDLPDNTDLILLEQHEMPDGSGIPKKIDAHRLNPLSCVFILTGILARYILAEGSDFQMERFLKKFEADGYNKGNFKESFSVLKDMQ